MIFKYKNGGNLNMKNLDLQKELKEVVLNEEEKNMLKDLQECVAGGNCGGNSTWGCICIN